MNATIPKFRSDFEILFDICRPALEPVIAEIVKREVSKILATDCDGKLNMYTRKEAAQKLGKSVSTIIKWQSEGMLKPIKVGKDIMYDRREVLSLIER